MAIGFFHIYTLKALTTKINFILEEYSDVYLDIEEALFIKVTQNLDNYYDEMYSVLSSLIKDQEKRENIGKKAREKFLREFSQDKIFDQYFRLITIKK